MAFKFYCKSVPFWIKAGQFYFFITCLLSVIIMKAKLNIIEEFNPDHNPQYFENLTDFSIYFNNLGSEHGQLRVFYEIDFVFMFGYTGWFLFFVLLVNKIKKQPRWITILLLLLIAITLCTDVYENTRLLMSMCSIETFKNIHDTFCSFCNEEKDYFNWYYKLNYWIKYSAAGAFIVLYLFVYWRARKAVMEECKPN